MTRIFSATTIQGRWFKLAAASIAAAALWPAAAPSGLPQLVRAYRANPNPAKRAAIESYAAAHPNEAPLAQLALGVSAYEQKDYAGAIAALRGLSAKLPLIADYPAYYLGAARVESNDFDGVGKDLGPVHAGSAASPLAGKSWLLDARSLQASAAPDAVRILREHYKELPQPDGDLTLADSFQAANQLPQAADIYQRVYSQYPLGAAADKAFANLTTLKASMGAAFPEASPPQLLHRADRLYELRAYPQARAEYQAAADRLTGTEQDQARVRMIATSIGSNAGPACASLTGLSLPESEADAERLYDVEECAHHLNNDEGANTAVRTLAEKYPKSPWRAKALLALANRYLLDNRASDYLPIYQAIYTDFPSDANAGMSHWKVTFHAYLRNEIGAEDLLRAHLELYPGHGTAGAALYFLGRVYEAKNDAAGARACYQRLAERFQNSYYAMLARAKLSVPEIAHATPSPGVNAFLAALKFPLVAPIPNRPTPATTLRIERSRLLRAAGLADLADSELRFGARTDAQPVLAGMEIASAADAPYLGVKAMKALAPDYLSHPVSDAPRPFWEYLYPLPYRTELTADARLHNLDPFLVAGLIRQESEFNPGAVSSASANGLMQVRVATGRQFERAAGVPRVTASTLLQPEPNLKIGTAVLRSMLDQNGGSMEQTLAAYNAGPRHATEWNSWNSYREPAEFVESIPFTETREYVQAVLRNAEMYRRLYGP